MSKFKKIRSQLILSAVFNSFTTLAVLGAFFFQTPVFASKFSSNQCNNLLSLVEGKPGLKRKALSDSSYAPIVAQRLANAKVLWVNFDLLRDLGIRIPRKGMTPEFRQELLDAFAYAIPGPNDLPGTFIKKFRTYFADRYGGMGMNGNLGSGRAASAGKVQVKGIGRTTLVGIKADAGHAHGGAWITEALHEAQWGEILHRELPHGANRVIAILDTGITLDFEGIKQPRAIIVREDPSRPAQYLGNESVEGAEAEVDRIRVQRALKRLPHILPGQANASLSSDREKLRAGLFEFADRIARQYAASFARSFYHGATSPSNILWDGEAIDYGTQTSIDGFGKIKILEDERPFGDIEEQKENLLYQIVDDLQKNSLNGLNAAIPTRQEIAARFEGVYQSALKIEMLALTGAPPEIISKINETSPSTRLQQVLLEVAHAGNDTVIVPKGDIPLNTGRYDLRDVLTTLTQASFPFTPESLNRLIADKIPDEELRNRLVIAYSQFMNLVAQEAARNGINGSSLATYVHEAGKTKNRKTPDLHIGPTRWNKMLTVIEEAKGSEDDNSLLQTYVDSMVENNIRNYKGAKPYQVILNEQNNFAAGTSLRTVFDAKTGKYFKVFRLKPSQGKLNFRGIPLSLKTAEGLSYFSSNSPATLRATLDENILEIAVPVPAATTEVDLAILLPSGAKISLLERKPIGEQ